MSTKNPLPFSNQFERGHSFNWAGKWTSGKYYMNDEYVTDFIVYQTAILVCRKNHQSSRELEPKLIIIDGRIVGVDSPYWGFVVAPSIDNGTAIARAEFIPNATEEDVEADPTVIIGKPYVKFYFVSGSYLYVPVEDIITQYKVGVPVLTQAMYDDLPDVDKPDPWLQIPDETDLTPSNPGTYLNILFSSIRKLQAEVAKLRNSFNFGIESYTGKDTAMSAVVSEYESIDDDEPLWSIDEDDLSGIDDATFNLKAAAVPPLNPVENIEYDANGVVTILDTVSWVDPEMGFQSCTTDTKILLYLTCTNLHINCLLTGTDSDNVLNIDLATLGIPVSSTNKYNICLLVSRAVQLDEDDPGKYGKNYIWFSITSYLTDATLLEGYYDPNTNKVVNNRIELPNAFTISEIIFESGELYKFNGYSKYQDFSHQVIPSKSSDSDYKYKVAHIAIRAVDDFNELESIEDYLLDNELIWESDKDILWINTKRGLRQIGSSGGGGDSGMTKEEILELLQDMGIVYIDDSGLQLSDVADISIINSDTGKKFKFTVDAEGDLRSTEIPAKTLKQMVEDLKNSNYPISETSDFRGFIAKLLSGRDNVNPLSTADHGLNSDRVKIGAFYSPLKTDTKFGCSHGYIELENTSDEDIPLDNVYLHFLHTLSGGQLVIDSIELDGYVPAGGTYLVRCKKYADPSIDADVYIDVKTYDKEWWLDGELMDISVDTTNTYGFALTYGDMDGNVKISPTTVFVYGDKSIAEDQKRIYTYKWYFIDAIVLNSNPPGLPQYSYWAQAPIKNLTSNTIIKNTFELDPAKQAYQALTTNDSSRYRTEFKATDVQRLRLDKEFIEFPLTDTKYAVNKYTPKSSKQHKNVSTDKTWLNYDKPNMVTCSFGRNIYTTRTFNWISAGQFDEYVWLKSGNTWIQFESYKASDAGKEQSSSYPCRKEWGSVAIDAIYKRIVGDFPGDGSTYTSHKCILNLVENPVLSPTTYTYIVGRADKLGNPDFDHCSEEYTFTLYPTSYVPRIYQTTDQQGFHWIEYQVWAAAAEKINSKIEDDCQNEHIIPILLNTGDMVQNGTRINEWLDYYNGGVSLFKHLEQMNVVGNNDLCNTDPEILGTGDDNGKSNSFYFHVFYCYEVDDEHLPVILGDDNVYRYIPSLYYIDSDEYRLVFINSEITYVNCDQWFDKHITVNGVKYTVNVYTGWAVPTETLTINSTDYYTGAFTSIYTLIYHMFNEGTIDEKNIIAICHEMPFTVITKDGLAPNAKSNYRSLSGTKTTLIGSHTNQLTGYDRVAIHWFSRLMEYFGVKLCLGGHKHTYACTFPLAEYYYYDSGEKNSKDDGPMEMEQTLANDLSTTWFDGEQNNLTKLPLISSSYRDAGYSFTGDTDHFSPTTVITTTPIGYSPVVYMMCQASGYKLTSNKELPSNYQQFSMIIPETTEGADGDTADNNQKYPMITITKLSGNTYTIELIRMMNIMYKYKFTQTDYIAGPVLFSYGYIDDTTRYINWTIVDDDGKKVIGQESETTLITV